MPIRLKGKYLKPIEAYVESLGFEDWLDNFENASYQPLSETILKLHPFLDGGSVFQIVFSELSKFFREKKEGQGRLSNALNNDYKSDLIERLKSAIERYPRKYEICIETSGVPYFGDAAVQISDQISWVSGSYVFEEPSTNRLAEILQSYVPKTPKACTFFRICVDGYGDRSADSSAVAEAISLAKQATFILFAKGILVSAYSGRSARATLTPLDELEASMVISLPDSLARGIGKLSPNEKQLIAYDERDEHGRPYTILGNPGRPAANDQEKLNALVEGVRLAKDFFAKTEHADFESISSAIEWYEDSVFSDNQTFSYLAACIGMEALLGEREHLNEMTNRLCDRYSFLMGKGSSERKQLWGQYHEILDIRGKLVHAKKRRLDRADASKLWRVQDMLLQTIRRELRQMIRDTRT